MKLNLKEEAQYYCASMLLNPHYSTENNIFFIGINSI